MLETRERFPQLKFYLIAIAVCMTIALLWPRVSYTLDNREDQRQEIMNLLEEAPDEIISIVVKQANEVPTGTLILKTYENTYSANITDTSKAVKMLEEYGVNYHVTPVAPENYFIKYYFPLVVLMLMLMGTAYMFFVIMKDGARVREVSKQISSAMIHHSGEKSPSSENPLYEEEKTPE